MQAGDRTIDFTAARKPELKARLRESLEELQALRDSVARLLKQSSRPPILKHKYAADDSVPPGWVEQHNIDIPRADGIFESAEAWVRVKHGVIVGAGLKNQSILMLMVSLKAIPEYAEDYANLFRDWRAAFLSCVDPVKWTAEEGRGDMEAWSKEDRYSKLQNLVDKDDLLAMSCIVASRPKAKHMVMFHGNKEAFANAFKTVTKAMERINRQADDALEALKKCRN